MKSFHHKVGLAVLPLCLALTGCETSHHIIIEQPKPMEVNINLSGRLELVIEDARQDMEQITGEKAQRAVRPEDIGLPLVPTSSAPARPGAAADMPRDAMAEPVTYLVDFGRTPAPSRLATEADLKASMAKRHADIRAILDAKVAGEAHTGLLVVRGKATADQQTTIAAENADRSALYQQEAQRRKITQDDVALSYYLARLGYAKKGEWYEKYNKDKSAWEWKQWGID